MTTQQRGHTVSTATLPEWDGIPATLDCYAEALRVERVTRKVRRQVIEMTLRQHPERSDRVTASDLAVGRELVASVRRDLADAGIIPAESKRVGADGKSYSFVGRRARVAPSAEVRLTDVAKEINEMVERTLAEGFVDMHSEAGPRARGLFHAAVIRLAARTDQLRKAKGGAA
jgi:hypothetical protein